MRALYNRPVIKLALYTIPEESRQLKIPSDQITNVMV